MREAQQPCCLRVRHVVEYLLKNAYMMRSRANYHRLKAASRMRLAIALVNARALQCGLLLQVETGQSRASRSLRTESCRSRGER